MTNFKCQMTNVGAIILVGLFLVGCAPKKSEEYKTVKVSSGNIKAEIPTTGIVMPRNRLEIKPPIAGRVEQILVQEGRNVSKGQILAWMSSNDRAALLDAARAKGEEEVKHWEDVYKPAPIIAPLSGFIIQRNVEPGQSVGVSDAILVMADKLIIKAQVDETDIGRIAKEQNVVIELDAYPGKEIVGKVEHIAYESETISNVTVYNVDVLPAKVPDYFRAGMSATVNFVQDEKSDVLLLPLNVVEKKGERSYVFIKDKADKIKAEQVKIGLENTVNVEIVSGLAEGDEVIRPTKALTAKYLGDNRRRGPMNPFSKPQN
ncbi:MAG: HlyD family efflux transporter periplasmic adaptor subunit [bacterium]